MADVLLSTADNPYNPFTNWDEWYAWDEAAGYATCGLVARYAVTSDQLSEADQDAAYEDAIESIISDFPDKMYVKVENNLQTAG